MGGMRTILRFLPRNRPGDAVWSILHYLTHRRSWPRIRRPRTLAEHLFARRFSQDLVSPLRRRVTDKYEVKGYVSEKVGHRYTVPTVALLRSDAEVHEYRFPDQCVVNPAHMSGAGQFRRSDADMIDRAMLCRLLSYDYSNLWREANYRGLPGRIIVEPFVFGDARIPQDYRVHCFGGEPKFVRVSMNLDGVTMQRFYTPKWAPLTIRHGTGLAPVEPPPENLEEMLHVSRALSADFDFIRVDLYSNGRDLKVGELTNLPMGGMRFQDYEPRGAEAATGRFFDQPGADPSRELHSFIDSGAGSDSRRERSATSRTGQS